MTDLTRLSNEDLLAWQCGLRAGCAQARSEGNNDEAYSIAMTLRKATAEMQRRMAGV